MSAGVSLDQLLKRETVLGVLSRYHAPGNAFQNYYGLGITASGAQQIYGNTGQYDIFDGSRSLGYFSASGAPPNRMPRKPIGSIPITVPRMYMSIDLLESQMYNTRELGSNPSSPIRGRGLNYYKAQVLRIRKLFDTTMEFMATRLFMGGYGIKPLTTGSPILVPCELGDAAAIVVNGTGGPAGNITTVGGLFPATDSWYNPATDIVGQLFELQVLAARQNGRGITDIWINGTTAKYLFQNDSLRLPNGSINRVFSLFNKNKEVADMQKFPDTGYSMEFGALPGYLFHIYNQGYVLPGTGEDMASQISATYWRKFIPDNVAIMTPPPDSDWLGMVQGSELMRWNLMQRIAEEVLGFGMGEEWAIEPPRVEKKMLYNGSPAIFEPYAPYMPTVINV